MHPFSYLRATSVPDAVRLARLTSGARLLSGGVSLIPMLRQRLTAPAALIDIAGIDGLDGIRVDGAELVIGARATHDAVARSACVAATIPALADLVAQIGDPQVRNRGTIGGALAVNDPASDYVAAALGLAARIVTDRRTITADAFFAGTFETSLARDEIITEVRFQVPERAAYARFTQPASRYPLVGVMVAKLTDGVRVTVTGASPCVFRHIAIESALSRDLAAEALDELTIDADGLTAGIHGSPTYRAHLIKLLAKRAVAAAH